MNYIGYFIVPIVVGALLGYMRRPQMPKGKTVSFPVFMAVIGAVVAVLFVIFALWAYKDDGIGTAVCFLLFSFLGLSLVVAYFNCRISYNEKNFTAKNFWGITRTYTYDEITRIKGTKDVKLYVGKRVVRVDEMAIGKQEFLCYAESCYMKTSGGRGIPIHPPEEEREFDLFNGNVENPGEIIFVYVLMLGVAFAWLGIVVHSSIPPKAEDLIYSTAQIEHYEVEDDRLNLYAKEEALPFVVSRYHTSLKDAELFLRRCDDGETITLGYVSYSESHSVYYIEDDEGIVCLTIEAVQDAEKEYNKQMLLFVGGIDLLMVLVIAVSIYVGRNPDRFSSIIVGFFFKEGTVRRPVKQKNDNG